MASLALAAFALLAVIDWVAVAQDRTEIEYLAKPAALAALLLYAATGSDVSLWLIAALLLSLLGDVYLMLPADLFVPGLAAFLLGHLAYIAAFDAPLTPRLAWWAATLALSAPLTRQIFRALDEVTLRRAVALYMAVISLMVASALASGSLTATVGALLFFASDAIIAWNRFVQPLAWAEPTIIVSYHLGQLGLVIALRG